MPMRTPSKPFPALRTVDPTGVALEVTVLYRNPRSTLSALGSVVRLSDGLSAAIRLLVLQVVPYPLPIEKPDVSLGLLAENVRRLTSTIGAGIHVDIRVGRDRRQMLESALTPGSLIVMGGAARWWPGTDYRTAKRLRRLGHQVLYANSE